LMQLPPFCFSLYELVMQRRKKQIETNLGNQVPGGDADVLVRWIRHLPLLALTGVVLAVHFLSWSWSISNTSLTHSMLLVCSHPVLIVFATWFAFAVLRILQYYGSCTALVSKFHIARPGLVETLGASVAMAGAVIMVAGISSSNGGDGD